MVGVLALQGDVSEHLACLAEAGAEACEVRTRRELDAVDGLILPGGESTTVGKLLARFGLLEPLRRRIESGMPVYGTCTGLILLAREIEDGIDGQPRLGTMDITARRNAFGRQRESFEAPVALQGLGGEPFPAVFIRAPDIASCGPRVEVLGRMGGRIVAARQGGMLVTAFHPELTGDLRVHRYFGEMVRAVATVGIGTAR